MLTYEQEGEISFFTPKGANREGGRREVKEMASEWANATTTAVTDSLTRVVSYLPNLIGAVVVILIGIVVAWALKTVVLRVLGYVQIKPLTDTIGLDKVFKSKVNYLDLIGDLVQWIVVIVFLIPALEILSLTQVNEVLQGVVAYIPNVVAAVFIVMIGAIVADLVAKVVQGAVETIGARTAAALADVARYSIIVFVVIAALSQLGIASFMLNTLFTGFVALVAIAGGLAFGLGGQDSAKDLLTRLRKNLPR